MLGRQVHREGEAGDGAETAERGGAAPHHRGGRGVSAQGDGGEDLQGGIQELSKIPKTEETIEKTVRLNRRLILKQ